MPRSAPKRSGYGIAMETLGTAWTARGKPSATVPRVGHRVAKAAVVSLLALGGFAASLSVARPAATAGTTGTTPIDATTTVSTAPAVLSFVGHGYGHGIGMSQWGAYGYAQHGLTYDRILAHYYPGTELAPTRLRTLRVLIAEEPKTTVGSAGPFTLTDAAGVRLGLDPGSVDLGAALELPDHPELSPPFTFTSPSPLTVDGHAYRGKLVVSSNGRLLTTIDVVGLEQYLKGVVPAEMPSNWSAEALRAQAVAARSYALANLVKSRPFDLYRDVRSQVYGGIDVESDATSAAVDATRAQVLLYGGKVADTLFYASSGGRTVSARDATGVAVPYLVSVADPYDTLSPYHDWGPVLLDATTVAARLKLDASIVGLSAGDGASGRVKTLALTGSDESVTTFTGNQIRTALGLRSTWFTPTLLRLQPAAARTAYGAAATLTGSASGTGASLEARPAGDADWTAAGAVVLRPDGSFAAVVKPRRTTWYRLADGDVRVGLTKVSVAARVSASVSSARIVGGSRPRAAEPVELQVRRGSAWVTVSQAVANKAGRFSFARVAAGTYRVRVAPGHGIVPGVSSPLAVS
jgi:stage II sporulation protein D